MILGHGSPRLDLRGKKRCTYLRVQRKPLPSFGELVMLLSQSALSYLDRLNTRIDHLGGE